MNAPASRETFRTSRLLDFVGERELTTQIGHRPEQWPQVVVKELVDNALDACEEAGVAPRVEADIGPGGEVLAREPLVWAGAPGGQAWRARPLRFATSNRCIFKRSCSVKLMELE